MSKTWNLTEYGPLGRWNPERSEKRRILPKQAQWLLENCNTHNRPLERPSIKIVEEALLDDTWVCNGETVIFAWDGTLLDGQNRLWACVNTGKPLETWVVLGLRNKEAFMSIDRGRNRTNASDLGIMGEKNPKELASVLVMLKCHDNGSRGSTLTASPRVHTRDLLATLVKHPNVRESTRWAINHRQKILAPQRVVGFVHYLAGISGNPKILIKRNEFFDRLADGSNLPKESPILALRNRWSIMAANTEHRITSRQTGGVYYCLWSLIRAWNAYLMGHELTKVQMPYKNAAKNIPADVQDVRSYFRRPSDKNEDGKTVDAPVNL